MKINIKPLYSKLNDGLGNCPLGCQESCAVQEQTTKFKPPSNCSCPLYQHQAEAYPYLTDGDVDVIFITAPTAGGKSLLASLPSLLDPNFRMMAMYPTIELVEDQTEQQKNYHQLFNLDADKRIDRLFGVELTQRVKDTNSNRFEELLLAIENKEVILTNPDIFHLITHFRYRNPAYSNDLLPLSLAKFPDLWVFDEFHIFGAHQETAILNSMTLIRRTQQRKRRFLFTTATVKTDFIEQLKQSGLKIVEISGDYRDETQQGYRQILQTVELSMIQLKDEDSFDWVINHITQIREILTAEEKGRGLIILNSVVMARKVANELQSLLPEIEVREISGRIERKERSQNQELLQTSSKPVLVVATSAVDVGVDFRIHLLITEGSDSATVIQRLGRLGRHSGFSKYQAFLLISQRTPWVMSRLEEKFTPEETVTRQQLINTIQSAFNPPQEYQEYRNRWGAIQAQGMFAQMTQDYSSVMKEIQARMTEDLQRVYGDKIDNKAWYAIGDKPLGKAIKDELLKFRGSSSLQVGVWDENRFYTYDLLRLLPYATVEILDRETFLENAIKAGHIAETFPEKYIQVYLRINKWLDERLNLSLFCNRDNDELTTGELCLISRLKIDGHPQAEVVNCLSKRKLLTFLVPVNKSSPQSHWEVSRCLNLSPLFGLYRLRDASEQAYACAFNQDALLLEALKWRLKKFNRNSRQSLIF